MKKLWAILIFIGASLLLYLYVKVQPSDTAEESPADIVASPASIPKPDAARAPETNPYDIPQADDPRLTRLADGRVHYKPSIETSRTLDQAIDANEALEVIDQLIGHYRYAYQENPVSGENFEIVEQLLGKNPKQIVFLDPESQALKGKQLIDQWGTPYFFHALSGQQMDIRSAGPDQTLWTVDDVFLDQQ